jgi:para-aminobenzoate synthetase component 1
MNAQPTVLTRSIDLDLTPEQVFENLHQLPGFFFLDSGLADHELSRYSYLAVNPFLTVRSRGDGIDVIEGKRIDHRLGNPIDVLSARLNELRLTGGSPLVPFATGGVGYFSYELGRRTVAIDAHAEDDLGLPEMSVSFYRTLLAYEHRTRRWIGASADLTGGRGTTVRKRLGNEVDKLKELAMKPHRGPVSEAPAQDDEEPAEAAAPHPGRRFSVDGVEVTSTMSRDEYLAGVRTIQEHIAAGDIYQANLTQRWTTPYDGSPGRLYHALRKASPAPYGIYLHTGECIIAGSSPELFLQVQGRTVETRPIKGTRRRGESPEQDSALRGELEASDKDRAELTMIADLERNDLGKVCTPGSVTVDALHRVESFSNVHHLVSTIRGELEPGTRFGDLMQAAFPSGSITGAPKKRAMEILETIEGTARGPYTGAMGYIGFDGAVSLNVAIRTLVLSQGQCHLGVGGGIVADSDPAAEYDECMDKARGMLAALREAQSTEDASVTAPQP